MRWVVYFSRLLYLDDDVVVALTVLLTMCWVVYFSRLLYLDDVMVARLVQDEFMLVVVDRQVLGDIRQMALEAGEETRNLDDQHEQNQR